MTGVRVLSDHGRRILKLAGANVDETSRLVRFPRALIEEAIRLATKKFKLGSRRSGRDLEMNSGNCSLLADGGAISVLDWKTGDLRSGTMEDWLTATHLIDAIAEIGVYWNMIQGDFYGNSPGDYVFYWRNLLKNCSKHIQDSTDTTKKSKILLEILQTCFAPCHRL
jgi:trimethylamine--corrinoid protein Co-methyltransferase